MKLLFVANFAADTGYAWDTIEAVFREVGERLVREGMLTSRLGSVIGRPSRVSSSNTPRHEAPKLIVWCACPGSSAFTPTCRATQDGEYTGRRGPRRPGTSRHGWSVVTTTASAV